MRARFAAIVAGGVAIAAACSAYDEAPVTEAQPDASVDAPDAGTASDAEDTNDANDGAVPPGMVVVDTAATRYAIDAREVTVKEWKAFRDTRPFDVTTLPASCAWKVAFGPRSGSCDYDDTDALPIHCIDWCDAHAYCAAVGRRLCGKIGGGEVPRADQQNPSVDQWTRACANGLDANRWSYGPTFKPSTCNSSTFDGGGDSGNLQPPGSLPGCEGGVAGLFDMSGNAWEWEDSACLPGDAGPQSDSCRIRGGSYQSSDLDTKCINTYPKIRGDVTRTVGVRCCKDL